MKVCGPVRIDESGRIALPVEMRKVIGAEDSRLAELYVERDKLIIKRYSPLKNIEYFAEGVCGVVGDVSGEICVICDCERVLACSSKTIEGCVGKKISPQISSLLQNAAPVLVNSAEGGKIFVPCENFDFACFSAAALPLYINSAPCGCIMLFSGDKSCVFGEKEMTVLKLAAQMLTSVLQNG